MDTKLKKSKGVISFICINLAVLLLLACVGFAPYLTYYYKDVIKMFNALPHESYTRNTITKEFVCEFIYDSLTIVENGSFYNYFYELAEDKNIYFEVRDNNVVKIKSKNGSFDNTGLNTNFGDSYNAVFHFKNGRLSAIADGEDLDIYGNNIYYPHKNSLFIPGYSNFEATESQKQVEILIGLKGEPVIYSENGQTIYSSIYSFNETHKLMRAVGVGFVILLFVMAALFIIGIMLRKHKKPIDQFFAKLIKFIPLEFKVFCLCLLASVWFYFLDILRYRLHNNDIFNISLFLSVMLSLSAIDIWLLRIDFKYNKPIYKQSVIYLAYQLIALPNVKKGVFRKQIRLSIISVACFVVAIFCFLLTILAFNSYSPLTAVICFIITCVFIAGCFFSAQDVIAICKNTGKLITYLEQLSLGQSIAVPKVENCIEIQAAIDQLTGLEKTLQLSLQEKMKAEHLKIELIANVSHDIKTPLTSVISYVDLLKEETDLPQHVKDYITVLDEKSQRLKNMVQDIFEVSKAASGELSVMPVTLDLCRLLRQTIADSADAIAQSEMIICENLDDEPCEVIADSNRMYRVYQNLISNALKYSIKGTRIHINVQKTQNKALVSIKNISAQPLDDTVDFTQRFVRGDASRTDGGSGLGLSIASSFTNACGGKFYVQTNADLFSVYTEFELTNA